MWEFIDLSYSNDQFTCQELTLTAKPLFGAKPILISVKKLSLGLWTQVFDSLYHDHFAGGAAPFFSTGMHPICAVFMNNFDNFTIRVFRVNNKISQVLNDYSGHFFV
jgi:hypothetical protein